MWITLCKTLETVDNCIANRIIKYNDYEMYYDNSEFSAVYTELSTKSVESGAEYSKPANGIFMRNLSGKGMRKCRLMREHST